MGWQVCLVDMIPIRANKRQKLVFLKQGICFVDIICEMAESGAGYLSQSLDFHKKKELIQESPLFLLQLSLLFVDKKKDLGRKRNDMVTTTTTTGDMPIGVRKKVM